MSVPGELLMPFVAEFVGESPTMNGELPGLLVLAEKTALSYDTIQELRTGKAGQVSFEVADRVLCATNAVQAWHSPGPLRDIYLTHTLSEVKPPSDRCQRKGCSSKIPPKTWSGGQPRKYCSRTCRDAASRTRLRDKIRKGRYSNPLDKCVNGHDWSPENTYISPGGKRLCRPCMRKAQKLRRRKRRLERERAKLRVAA